MPNPDGPGGVDPSVTSYAYDADGNLVSTTDPLGHVTRYGYDALNRRTQVTDALGSSLGDADHTTTTVYDAVGNVLSVQDSQHNTTSYAYDRLGRTVAETDPLSQNTTYRYDAAGNLAEKTDRDGRVVEYSYDPLGRQVEERWRPDANSAVFHTIHTYFDAGGQVLGVRETDTGDAAAGTLYEYAYDADGRVTSSRMAPGDLTQSASPAVNTGQLGDGLNGEQLLDWDSDGVSERADEWTFSLTAGVPVLLNLNSTAFDATLIVERPGGDSGTWLIDSNSGGDGNAMLWFTPDATGTWTVFVTSPDVAGGAYTLEETANAHPIVPAALVEFDYAYDPAGNLLTASENASASAAAGLDGATTDSFDALNRLVQTKQTAGGSVTKRADFAYRDDGSLSGVTRYSDDGITQIGASSYNYDGMGRLTGLVHTPAGSPAISYAWSFDAASRMSLMTTPDGTTNSIGYDATDQVTGVDYTYQAAESYTYDSNGNRTNTGYTTGADNRLTTDGTYRYASDNEGNRTLRYVDADASGTLNAGDTDIINYAWDHRNRLTSVSHYATYADYQAGTTDSVVQYTYDYLGRRILRRIDADGSGAGAADFDYNVYQGDNAALEIHDANGLATSGTGENAPHRQHRYLHAQAVDQVLASEDAVGDILWGLADHEGTIRDILNNSGTAVDHRQFDSFGKMTSESAPATDFIFGYAGRPWDAASGLYDNRARWYDPSVGRFASEDPSGFAAGDANLYRYAANKPLTHTDPTGLTLYSDATAAISAAETALQYVYQLQGSGASSADIQAAYGAYQAWNVAANNAVNNYLQNGWGSSIYGPGLSEKVNALPVSVDGVSTQNNAQYLSAMTGAVREQGNAIGGIVNQWDATYGALWGAEKTLLTGAAVIGVAMIPVVGPLAAAGLMEYGLLSSLDTRLSSGQSIGESTLGTAYDMLGVTGIVAGGWNVDAATGRDLNLNYEQQGEQFGSGVTAAGMWAATPFISKPAGQDLPAISEENWSNPMFGRQVERGFGDILTQSTETKPEDWIIRTGRTGIDAEWRGNLADNPGFDYAELKPATENGLKTFKSQMENWWSENGGPIEEGQTTQLWIYDQEGNIMSSGRNYMFQADTLTWSNAPGYGPGGGQSLVSGVPDLVWGAGAAGFSGTTNSSRGGCWGGFGR